MLAVSILFIIFWILIFIFPNLVAYLVGAFFLFVGINFLVGYILFKQKFKKSKDSVVEAFWYKVYKDKDKK